MGSNRTAAVSGAATLAGVIQQRRDELFREWSALVSKVLGERLGGPQLRDGLPGLLDAIVAHLSATSDPRSDAAAIAQHHGSQRLRTGLDLDRLLREYGLLRQVILRTAERAGVEPSWHEVMAMDELLDLSMAEAGARYAAERRAAEKDFQTRFREISDHARGAVFVKESDGRFVWANRWLASLLGRRPDELPGLTSADVFPPDVARQMAENERRAAAGEEVLSEETIPTPRGERTLMTVLFPFRTSSGDPAVGGISFDVTDRKLAQDELQHASELLELGDAFLELDRSWRIVRVNANQERLSRRARSETLGRNLWEVWPDAADPASRFWTEYHRAMDERVPVQFEGYTPSLDLWTAVTAYPVSGRGIAVFFRDVTERKEWEQRLQQAREFEQHLLGIVSHDLRTPLGTVVTSARTLVARDDLGEAASRTVARILSAGERATRMTSDLLDLAAARVGERIPMNAAPMDLGLLADELADEVALSYPGRTLDVHRDGDLRGHWDRDRLAQLLSNLLTNAFKYGAAGPVRVELHDAGDDVILAIRNSGPPIPADALPHLFEPLRWRDEERAGRDHGSYRSVGLGLFIVREIAKAHGGTVTVESATNDGTTFTVRLPRHARPDASATN